MAEFTQANLSSESQSTDARDALRIAREKANLSVADIANELHLTVSVIEKIEANKLEDIAPIFARGYIRSYAKFVGAPEEAVNELLELLKERDSNSLHIEKNTEQTTRFIRDKKHWPKVVTLTTLAILVIGSIMLWQHKQSNNQQASGATQISQESLAATSDVMLSDESPATTDDPAPEQGSDDTGSM